MTNLQRLRIEVLQLVAIAQYKNGLDKALNSVVGGVMKRHKADPAFVSELILEKIA